MRGLEGELVLAIRLEPAFLLNFVVDLAWLWATGALAGAPLRRRRLLLAAALGAAGAVWSYFPSGRWLGQGWGLLPGSLAVLFAAFGPRRLPEWLRLGAYFLFTGAAMAGSALVLGRRAGGPVGAALGRVPAPAGVAAALGILCCLVGMRRLWSAAQERGRMRAGLYGLRIFLQGKAVEVPALLDTGNQLKDPLTGRPVVVLEAAVLEGMLPPSVVAAASRGWRELDGLPAEVLEAWAGRLRMVPFRSVGRTDGLLLAFLPDQMTLRAPGRDQWVAVSALVGLAPAPLQREGAYRALLPAVLAQGADEVPGKTGEVESG